MEKEPLGILSRAQGCLAGLAVGDAIGTALEFERPGTFKPIDDLVGGGPFNLEPGQWTDDTSMALCLADSLVSQKRFDPKDQMERYAQWYRNGLWSATGSCFDIGITTRNAIQHFELTGEPYSGSTDENASGNGCIMRLAPVPIAYHTDAQAAIFFSGESARTTHGSIQCVEASQLFGAMLWRAIHGYEKKSILLESGGFEFQTKSLENISTGSYLSFSRDEIVGNGYVVRSLEAALWCFAKTDSYRDAVLMASNLGNDADTTAAICGQIAGAYYGVESIPAGWMEKLAMRDQILELASRLLQNVEAR